MTNHLSSSLWQRPVTRLGRAGGNVRVDVYHQFHGGHARFRASMVET